MPQQSSNKTNFTKRWFDANLNNFRHRLAYTDALPQLAFLGCISGLASGLLAVLFRLSFELPLQALLGGDDTEVFEALSSYTQFLLPLSGAVLVGIILSFIDKDRRTVGVAHVVDRVHLHQGRLPGGNALVQFVCGSLLLSTGNPVGREGPAVHLGATCASGLGRQMKLPNNNLRLLSGCGVAAAIAASFNTPLAGVIFAMEVVLMEYTVTGFIPIILAAVCGAVVSRAVYGDAPAFLVPSFEMNSLWELPYLVLSGLLIGIVAAGILRLHKLTTQIQNWPIFIRALIAGLIAGGAGLVLPQLLGLGYDSIEQALLGQLGMFLLLSIGLAKLAVASTVAGLGLPGGLISPTLVSGACLGGALGLTGAMIFPGNAPDSGFYAMLGMGAMMGAMLNAPLAALMALLELTYNPKLLMPAMLIIVVACITARLVARLPGLFLIGRDPHRLSSPVIQMLNRAGVTSLMNKKYACSPHLLTWKKARELLEAKPDWLIIEDIGEPRQLLHPSNLAHFLQESDTALWDDDQDIDLLEIPGKRHQLQPIHSRATLKEAQQMMQQHNANAVYVSRATSTPLQSDVAGIITKEAIEEYYQ